MARRASGANSPRLIVKFYKEYNREKRALDGLLKRFIEINKLIEKETQIRRRLKKDKMSDEFYLLAKHRSKQFIDSNYQIQIQRSANETLLDDIKLKKEKISAAEEELDRKVEVGQEFSSRIRLIRLKHQTN